MTTCIDFQQLRGELERWLAGLEILDAAKPAYGNLEITIVDGRLTEVIGGTKRRFKKQPGCSKQLKREVDKNRRHAVRPQHPEGAPLSHSTTEASPLLLDGRQE